MFFFFLHQELKKNIFPCTFSKKEGLVYSIMQERQRRCHWRPWSERDWWQRWWGGWKGLHFPEHLALRSPSFQRERVFSFYVEILSSQDKAGNLILSRFQYNCGSLSEEPKNGGDLCIQDADRKWSPVYLPSQPCRAADWPAINPTLRHLCIARSSHLYGLMLHQYHGNRQMRFWVLQIWEWTRCRQHGI